jgi:CSLREA domain-containing protein
MNESLVKSMRPVLATMLLLAAAGAHAAVGFGATIVVNTPNDEFGTVLQNCSLREAVQTANTNADFGGCTHTGNFATGANSDIVQLPAANPGYALARTGAEDDTNINGDLDIASNIAIKGAGAGTTPIFACAACPERVIEVVSGTNVDIEDVTLKLGHPAADGGGLYNNAGASLTLTRVTIGLNETTGNGGGIYNAGTLTIDASAIANNQVTRLSGGGGGIFNDDNATLTLNDSRVLDNTATSTGLGGLFGGGGIFSDLGSTLVLDNTTVDGNVATAQPGLDLQRTDGGGILARGQFTLTQSTVSNNISSGNDAEGGGIACSGFEATAIGLIERSVVAGNLAAANPDIALDFPDGGGISCSDGILTIVDSLIRDNTAERGPGGGGIYLGSGTLKIVNTTVSGNVSEGDLTDLDAGRGGGIRMTGDSLEIVNSTLSGNEAGGPGGALHVDVRGGSNDVTVASLSNVTIAGNTGSTGGGIFVLGPGGLVTIRNSALSGNLDEGVGDDDDCHGALDSQGDNLIENVSGCTITGVTITNLLGADAKLGALAANFGPLVGADNPSSTPEPLLTRLPAIDSPLLDEGSAQGCEDQAGFELLTDQRGEPRPVDGPDANATITCDIGAVELQDTLFKDSFE